MLHDCGKLDSVHTEDVLYCNKHTHIHKRYMHIYTTHTSPQGKNMDYVVVDTMHDEKMNSVLTESKQSIQMETSRCPLPIAEDIRIEIKTKRSTSDHTGVFGFMVPSSKTSGHVIVTLDKENEHLQVYWRFIDPLSRSSGLVLELTPNHGTIYLHVDPFRLIVNRPGTGFHTSVNGCTVEASFTLEGDSQDSRSRSL